MAATKTSPTNETRQRLIRATEDLLRRDGLARVTTRKIAQAAGMAEGALYHHFSDKAALLHAVVQHRLGDFQEVLNGLPFHVGRGTVSENLMPMLQAAFDFHFKIVPIACSLFADHALLARTRELLHEQNINPKGSIEALGSYLSAEQRLGRVNADIDPQAAAALLLAGSFHEALCDHFFARDPSPGEIHLRLQQIVQTVLAGLAPRPSEPHSGPENRTMER